MNGLSEPQPWWRREADDIAAGIVIIGLGVCIVAIMAIGMIVFARWAL